MKEQPVGNSGKETAEDRAPQAATAMGIASDADEVATPTHESEHVVHHQHRAGIVGTENGDDGGGGFGDAGANGVDDPAAQLVVDGAQSRITRLGLFDDWNAL